jgi:hypothetical protein
LLDLLMLTDKPYMLKPALALCTIPQDAGMTDRRLRLSI